MGFLSSIRISHKLALLILLAALALAATIGTASSFIHRRMMEDRIAKLHSVVDAAVSLAEDLHQEELAGRLTHGEALDRLRGALYAIRYDGKAGYVAAYTLKGILIASGAEPKAEGEDRIGIKDVRGKPIIKTMIDLLAGADEGTVDYWYPKPHEAEASPKLSYVRKFAPWDAFFFTGVYIDDIAADFRGVMIRLGLVAGAILAVMAASVALIGRDITTPLGRLKRSMDALSAGETEIGIPAAGRGDEIGVMARAVLVFKENAIRIAHLAIEQRQEQDRKDGRHKVVESCIQTFNQTMVTTLDTMASSSRQMTATAQSMSAMAEETSRTSAIAAKAAESATSDVRSVAVAAEQLSASVGEIARQVSQSASVVSKATAEAERTNEQVRSLSEAAQKINEVVQLIDEIAGQTNLLALNATIEAARAGEAGKGFAVVASEVKALAGQTGRATAEIAAHVRAIQDVTALSVTAIEAIASTVGEVNQIALKISSAVDQQGAATESIVGNIHHLSAEVERVSDNIGTVARNADETGAASVRVIDAAGGLADHGRRLQANMDRFVTDIRSA